MSEKDAENLPEPRPAVPLEYRSPPDLNRPAPGSFEEFDGCAGCAAGIPFGVLYGVIATFVTYKLAASGKLKIALFYDILFLIASGIAAACFRPARGVAVGIVAWLFPVGVFLLIAGTCGL